MYVKMLNYEFSIFNFIVATYRDYTVSIVTK